MSTSTVIDIATLITRSPDTCGNRPRIAGTRITVGRIATLWKQGVTPEEMVDNWPYLNLAQVYAALAYYHANKAEIEAILTADETQYDRYLRE
ncbi:DUF433 domain-containing protein [Aerosakkonemataceae cyanobacterium BLCC-F50]|uniref:DUF433 domain-containing protein n=1 Tax=Floridaenema flaviceps BLCC-F50 TaxID=3153642 RepID=A0ABV4XYJ2_9CYAN